MTQTTPTRDEAVRKIQSECDACVGVGRVEDPASPLVLGGFKDCPDCKGSGWVWKEYAPSAPAPASGRVDAVVEEVALDAALEAYREKACWSIVPANHREALRAALAASLSPAATPVEGLMPAPSIPTCGPIAPMVESFDDKWLGDGDSVHVLHDPTPVSGAEPVAEAIDDLIMAALNHERAAPGHERGSTLRILNSARSRVAALAKPASSPAGDTVTLTRQQLDSLLRAAYPLATATEREAALQSALADQKG